MEINKYRWADETKIYARCDEVSQNDFAAAAVSYTNISPNVLLRDLAFRDRIQP